MTHYLLSAHSPTNGVSREATTAEERRDGFAKIGELEAEMRAARALVFSGRLDEPSAATVARPRGGRVRMTDGPYLEAKEAIAGFYIIEAATPDQARQWAQKTAAAVGAPIEVRPFVGVAPG